MDRNRERERIKQIVSVFIKHGMRDGLRSINDPVKLRLAMEDLGPTFVKVGQILSTRPDIMPEPYIREFQKLQDSVKPESYEDIKKIIESELNGEISDLFLAFDPAPIASASLAQVHRAELKSGQRVVAKIQRPGARETMLSDIAIIKRLARFMKFTHQGNVINPIEVSEELWGSAKRELDFLIEAGSIERFYQNNKSIGCIECPKVYREYTTSNILVMDYIEGIKVTNTEDLLNEGYDLKDIALKFANNYFKQIFEDGFFHADPHPGNLLISGNRIAYIDFGIMGTLDSGMKRKLNNFLYGMAVKDIDVMMKAIIQIGIKKGLVDTKKLYSDIEGIYNQYIESTLFDLDFTGMMDEIFKVCRRNNISMPREIVLLLKGIVTVEGVVARIAPHINIMEVIIPYARSQILKQRDYRQDVMEQIDNLYILSRSGLKIPIKILELINSALAGKLKMQMEHTSLEKSIGELNKMTNRIVFSFIISSLIIGSSLVVNADAGPKFYGIPFIGFAGYIGAAVMGIGLLISIMRSGKI